MGKKVHVEIPRKKIENFYKKTYPQTFTLRFCASG